MAEQDTTRVLVTGANSGLGFAICCRLADEFLFTRPQHERLSLVITVRDQRKADDTLRRLEQYLSRTIQQRQDKSSLKGFQGLLKSRVDLGYELLDLNSLRSVRALAARRRASGGHFNAVILNAGIGGWTGLNWPKAVWNVCTDLIYAITFPNYKISGLGDVTRPQVVGDKSSVLGSVFCANVFGHYVLAHELADLLAQSGDGRVVWVSSLEAYSEALDELDFEGLKNPLAYESSKRLTDVLAISSRLPETRSLVSSFLSAEPSAESASKAVSATSKVSAGSAPTGTKVKMYLSHPGICATGIMPLPWILALAMTCAFYIARWTGSLWHGVTPYKGACAPVWLALASAESLDHHETSRGIGKWGSATDMAGHERAERTEVDGWGYGGIVGDATGKRRMGRVRGVQDLTDDAKHEFALLGRRCWSRLEELRLDYTRRLDSE